MCRNCRSIQSKKYRQENSSQIRDKKHKAYLKNKEKILLASKKRYLSLRDEKLEYAKQHYAENKDKRKEYIEANRESIRAYDRDRAKRPQRAKWIREYNRVQNHKRRGMKSLFSPEQFNSLVSKFDSRCAYCDSPMDSPTIDHVIPISKGGTGHIFNILPSCISCNKRKAAKLDYITSAQAIRILNTLEVSFGSA